MCPPGAHRRYLIGRIKTRLGLPYSLPRRRRIQPRPFPGPLAVRLLLVASHVTETRLLLWRYLYGQYRDDCDPTFGIPSHRSMIRVHGRVVYLTLEHSENSDYLTNPQSMLSHTDAMLTIIGPTATEAERGEAERIRLEVLDSELEELHDAKNPMVEGIAVLSDGQSPNSHEGSAGHGPPRTQQALLLERARRLAEQILCEDEVYEADLRSGPSLDSIIYALVKRLVIERQAEEDEAEKRRIEPLLAEEAARWSQGWRRFMRPLIGPTPRKRFQEPSLTCMQRRKIYIKEFRQQERDASL